MEDCGLIGTFTALNDWVKIAIILGFYGTILRCFALFLYRRPKEKKQSFEAEFDALFPPLSAPKRSESVRYELQHFVEKQFEDDDEGKY